jgi:hypothetical protein
MSLQLQALPSITPTTRPEAFFELLYGVHMNAFPKRSAAKGRSGQKDQNRDWVFVGSKDSMKSMATKSTLYAVLSDPKVDTTYYTPNGYYRRDLRLTETLRWLNAFVFDLDVTGEYLQDILDRVDRAGLPRPTAVIQTPSGGFHLAFMFTGPVRATPRAIRLFTAIMGHIAVDLGADTAAVGANRIFRTPTDQNLIYFDSANRYDFDLFKDWRDINHPYDPAATRFVNVQTGDLMNHPALQLLLESPCQEGRREQTAFTLALAMKASEWPQVQAEAALRDWFNSCCAKGAKAGKEPFTLRDAVYKAGYVYRKPTLHAPAAETIRELSGLPFYYQTRNVWEAAKPRSNRERIHLSEWEEDILNFLRSEKVLSGTQQELATRLNCPLASFKAVLKLLQASGTVLVETRRGRAGNTILSLPEGSRSLSEPSEGVSSHSDSKSMPENGVVLPRSLRSGESQVLYIDFQSKELVEVRYYPISMPIVPDPDPPD